MSKKAMSPGLIRWYWPLVQGFAKEVLQEHYVKLSYIFNGTWLVVLKKDN